MTAVQTLFLLHLLCILPVSAAYLLRVMFFAGVVHVCRLCSMSAVCLLCIYCHHAEGGRLTYAWVIDSGCSGIC